MNSLVFVLALFGAAAGLKKQSAGFLETATQFVVNPEGYTEDYRNLIWVLLANIYDDSDALDSVSASLIACGGLNDLKYYDELFEIYCEDGRSGIDIVDFFLKEMNRDFNSCTGGDPDGYYSTFESFTQSWVSQTLLAASEMLKTGAGEEQESDSSDEQAVSNSFSSGGNTIIFEEVVLEEGDIVIFNEPDCEESSEDEIQEEEETGEGDGDGDGEGEGGEDSQEEAEEEVEEEVEEEIEEEVEEEVEEEEDEEEEEEEELDFPTISEAIAGLDSVISTSC